MFKAGSLINKGNTEDKNSKLPSIPTTNIKVELSEEEIELMLITIKNTLFKGEYVELLYNLTLKLQKEYLHYKSKK